MSTTRATLTPMSLSTPSYRMHAGPSSGRTIDRGRRRPTRRPGGYERRSLQEGRPRESAVRRSLVNWPGRFGPASRLVSEAVGGDIWVRPRQS